MAENSPEKNLGQSNSDFQETEFKELSHEHLVELEKPLFFLRFRQQKEVLCYISHLRKLDEILSDLNFDILNVFRDPAQFDIKKFFDFKHGWILHDKLIPVEVRKLGSRRIPEYIQSIKRNPQITMIYRHIEEVMTYSRKVCDLEGYPYYNVDAALFKNTNQNKDNDFLLKLIASFYSLSNHAPGAPVM